jgi:hypothetical protein
MKTFQCAVALSTLLLAAALAQTSTQTNTDNATNTVVGASARDGFTLRGAEVVMTRSGVTTKVARDVVLPNGLRVLANGNIVRADGSSTALRPNQLLTLEGNFQDVILTPEGVAPLSSVAPGPAPKANAGISSKDGISISGTEVFLTRNGVTEKVTSDVRLPNGAMVRPNGTLILSNGNSVTLRPNQILDLNGVLRDAPASPAPRP